MTGKRIWTPPALLVTLAWLYNRPGGLTTIADLALGSLGSVVPSQVRHAVYRLVASGYVVVSDPEWREMAWADVWLSVTDLGATRLTRPSRFPLLRPTELALDPERVVPPVR